MVKCDTCVQASEARYVRPAGTCEQCQSVTPYSDRLCGACSDALARCQCCRSKRVLISVPEATQPVLVALAAQQAQAHARTPASPRPRSSPHSARYSSPSPSRSRARRADAAVPPHSAQPIRGNVDHPLHSIEGFAAASPTASGRGNWLSQSAYHFQSAVTYSLDALAEPSADSGSSQLQPSPPSHADEEATQMVLHEQAMQSPQSSPDPSHFHQQQLISAAAARPTALTLPPDMSQPLHGSVILSPSGKLLPATLTPLSPRMAVRQNALGNAPQVRGPVDAAEIVDTWSRPELVDALFHHYCHRATSGQLTLQMPLHRFRQFALDAGLVAAAGDGHTTKGNADDSNRIDILFTACTRPLSGGRQKMNEEQFFEALGQMALWKFGGGAASAPGSQLTAAAHKAPEQLVPALEQLFETHLVPLARRVVRAKAGGVGLRSEEFEPSVASLLLKYEEGLKRIFVRLVRTHYADVPRADEQLSHPLLEGGWKAFCRDYGFFPGHVSAPGLLKLFLAASTGLTRSGNLELPALSFDDFMHALFQLAQVSFALTPSALPIERVELLLHKIDQLGRELNFMPIQHRSGMGATKLVGPLPSAPAASPSKALVVVAGVRSAEDKREALMAALPSPNTDQQLDGVQSLFSESSMSCARDLFNLYCNTAAQSSYSEILPRLQWVKMLRHAGLLEGAPTRPSSSSSRANSAGRARSSNAAGGREVHRASDLRPAPLAAAEGDLIFNKVLAEITQAAIVAAPAFTRGRHMTFNVFLLGLVEAASRASPDRPIKSALAHLFAEYFEPLLGARVAALQRAQQQGVAMPLGAGINAGSSATPSGVLLVEEKHDGSVSGHSSSSSAAVPLYPNHPAANLPEVVDAAFLVANDAGVKSLLDTYGRALDKVFHQAAWLGVEAEHGVSIPRLGSSLQSVTGGAGVPSATALQHARSWDVFLQAKHLLSEHSFRRWLQLAAVVPTLLAHKQVTMLLRAGNVGFDRERNEFVLNRVEFRETLLRIALLAFCGPAYGAYTSAASKFELLLFMLDQSEARPGLQFRGFAHAPSPDAMGLRDRGERRADYDAPPYDTFWERSQASQLGVKALLQSQAHDGEQQQQQLQLTSQKLVQHDEEDEEIHLAVPSAALQSLPQDWGHGARSHTAIVTAHAPGVLPLQGRFNTSTSVPRTPFATEMLEPFHPARHTNAGVLPGNPPSMSPTKGLFARTPFRADKGASTKFAANVPKYAATPLGSPKAGHRA